MIRIWPLAALLVVAACGSDEPKPRSAFPVAEYLAQSISPDGNPATPLRAGDAMTWRRFDIGRYQGMTSFLMGDGAITAWSFAPYGAFEPAAEAGCPMVPCRGDGGEQVIIAGDRAQIVATQDGGRGGVQHFAVPWPIVDGSAPACGAGWLQATPWDRLCRTTITLPAAGLGSSAIVAAAFVSEHGDANAVERRVQARGWGLLWWAAFDRIRPPADPARCPDLGWNATPAGMRLTDCRLATQLEAADGSLSTAQLWRP